MTDDVEPDSNIASHRPRPAARLWIAVALGVLGAWLPPVPASSFMDLLATVPNAGVFAWFVFALAGVLVLHRLEQTSVPRKVHALMAVALVLSAILLLTPELSDASARRLIGLPILSLLLYASRGFRWLVLVVPLLAMGSGLLQQKTWKEALLRGPAIALASPLLLFSSRSRAAGGRGSFFDGLSRALCAGIPFALAVGHPMTSFSRSYGGLPDSLLLAFRSFAGWAWLGCALLFLLSPWPGEPRPRASAGRIGTALLIAMALVPWISPGHAFSIFAWVFLLFLILLWPWPGFALAGLLSPWPRWSWLSRLEELPPDLKLGPVRTAALLLIPLPSFIDFAKGHFLWLIRGRLFEHAFEPSWLGWVLDQSTLQSGLWRFTFCAALALSWLTIVRWFSDRRARWSPWIFAVAGFVYCALLLSTLTCAYGGLLTYVHTKGFTAMRAAGLLYGLGTYIATIGFLLWVVRPPGKEMIECRPS